MRVEQYNESSYFSKKTQSGILKLPFSPFSSKKELMNMVLHTNKMFSFTKSERVKMDNI